MLELLARGTWNGSGVFAPEAFDPDPFVALMDDYGFPGGLMEMDSEYKVKMAKDNLERPLP